jgi:C4-dicarboxylate-specific signal transduction histidine kinase
LEKEQGMRDQLVHADKLAALGKMVTVIAHEINNPIQSIKNTFYLLEDHMLPGNPAIEYLKMGSTEANRISDLVAQLHGTYASGSKAVVAA